MGTEDKDGFLTDNEGPIRKEAVKPFYIDKTAVTNKEFNEFINETGYVTDAEKYKWSFVFHKFLTKETLKKSKQLPNAPWWFAIEQAYWFQPEGPETNISHKMEHPVVHVSWNDAISFSNWAGKRLPTEKEWEFAARGGLVQKKYVWGDELNPNGKHYCNIWQGDFPNHNTKEDGFVGTSPANSFPANGYGLYNMAGNTWEWCLNNFDSTALTTDNRKSIRGGSYLCHHSYCNRYRVGARSFSTADSSTGNLGFRCVKDA